MTDLTPEQKDLVRRGEQIHAMRSILQRIAEHPLNVEDKKAMAQAAADFQAWAREALK